MHRAFFGVVLWLALPAQAETYRCVDPSGRSYFTNLPNSCSTAVPVELERELIRIGPSAAAAGARQPPVHRTDSASQSTFSRFLIPSSDVMGQWDVTLEAPEPVDPELRDKGLRHTVARHYTRSRGPRSEVCTVELWGFSDAESARRATASLELPNWKIASSDKVVILTHGVALQRGVGTQYNLAPDCRDLGQRTLERVVRMQ